jgi:hypothetical protein
MSVCTAEKTITDEADCDEFHDLIDANLAASIRNGAVATFCDTLQRTLDSLCSTLRHALSLNESEDIHNSAWIMLQSDTAQLPQMSG